MNTKEFALSSTIILAFIAYSFTQRNQSSVQSTGVPVVPIQTPTPYVQQIRRGDDEEFQPGKLGKPVVLQTPVPTTTPPPIILTPLATSQSPTITSQRKYKDGQYTGSVADAYYGNVQVRATVQNGTLTDVAFLQYPNDRSTSIAINSYATPILRSEAIQAQSALVDVVSGATATSQAFTESLTNALRQAAI